jgi:hypothetical protein
MSGYVRIESLHNQFSGPIYAVPVLDTLAPAPMLGLPSGTSSALSIVSIGGTPVPAAPMASFTNPDVALTSSQPLDIELSGLNIPATTSATVSVVSAAMGVQSVTVTLTASG